MNRKRIVTISGSGHGAGKTTLVERLAAGFAGCAAVKVRPEEDLSPETAEETDAAENPDKDTGRALAAGARKAWLVQGPLDYCREAVADLHNPRDPAVLRAIDRAVAELVENAIRHCPDEHPRILIEGGRTNGRVVLSVSDSGPAIPSTETDILTKELEPDQLTHGSGLGLWIVDRLTEQSNGHLAIERTEGVGNTVILELPSESG